MTVVLRLLGLHTEAGSEDIRRFFRGLYIPDGGVHILGGENGEAFIIFLTEREGQLAMHHSGKLLKGSTISLHISSVAELKRQMESRLRQPKSSITSFSVPKTTPSSSIDTNAALLLSLMAAVHGVHSNQQANQKITEDPSKNTVHQFSSYHHRSSDILQGVTEESTKQTNKKVSFNLNKPGYLQLFGFPDSICKQEVFQFLRGLPVLEVITNVRLKLGWCCLVKLASFTDVEEGLKYSHRKFREFNVEVRLAHEKMWMDATERSKNCQEVLKPYTSSEQNELNGSSKRCFTVKRNSDKQPSLVSPKKHCRGFRHDQTEYCIIVNNLSKTITKTEIKNIFGCPGIPNYKIKHLLDKWRERTSTAFVTFNNPVDHASSLKMNGTTVGSKNIEVLSITKEEIQAILDKNRSPKVWKSVLYGQTNLPLTCIYGRNFPVDANKQQVKDFFLQYDLSEDAIFLLVDGQGCGVGEAIVQFECEQVAKQAQKLHGKDFLGAKILLTCITHEQREKILGTL